MRVSRLLTMLPLLSLLLLLPVVTSGSHVFLDSGDALSPNATLIETGTVSRVNVQSITTIILSESVVTKVSSATAPVITEKPGLSEVALGQMKKGQLKRDGTCPAMYYACSTVGAGDSCCRKGSYCTTDWLNNVACCPLGGTCTGVEQSRWTYLPESYFPWYWVPKSFTDGGQCSSWYSYCQSNYVLCVENRQHSTAFTGGPGNSITLVSPGGDVTVAPTMSSLSDRVSQAISNCNRLGVDAGCGFQLSTCDGLPPATPIPTPTTKSLSFGKRTVENVNQPTSTSGAGSGLGLNKVAFGGVVAGVGLVLQVL